MTTDLFGDRLPSRPASFPTYSHAAFIRNPAALRRANVPLTSGHGAIRHTRQSGRRYRVPGSLCASYSCRGHTSFYLYTVPSAGHDQSRWAKIITEDPRCHSSAGQAAQWGRHHLRLPSHFVSPMESVAHELSPQQLGSERHCCPSAHLLVERPCLI